MIDALLPVETDRTELRAVSAADLPDLMRVNGDPEVTHFLPYATWTAPEDGRAWLARMRGLEDAGTARQLVVIERATAHAIGTCLLFRFEVPSRRAELGYALGRVHWGRGLMREALAALVASAFATGTLRRLEAEVDPENRRSTALLERLGFRLEGRLRQRWIGRDGPYDTSLYGLLAEDVKGESRGRTSSPRR